MSKAEFEKVAGIIDGRGDFVIDIQKRIVPVRALAPESGGEGESKKAAVVIEELKKLGVGDIEVIDVPDKRLKDKGRTNLIATIEGKDPAKSIWIMSHLDVVPPGEEKDWESPPWEARVDGDRIYGRGTEDNNQGICSSLVLAKALGEAGVKPDHDLKLLFIADEETGSDYGIQVLVRDHDLFRKDDIVIVPDGGEPDGSMIEVAEKSILWTKFTVKGKQTHASTPERGINAHLAGAAFIVLMQKLHDDFHEKDEVFDPPISTFEPTKKESNVPNVNTIPGEDVFYMDSRVLPLHKLGDVKRKINEYAATIEEKFRVGINMEYVQDVEAPPPTPVGSPVVKVLQEATKAVYDIDARPMGIGGGTVAAYLRKADIPAAVWATMDETMHGPNEYVKISNVLGDAKVFAHVCLMRK